MDLVEEIQPNHTNQNTHMNQAGHIIELTKLRVVTQEAGVIGRSIVKVNAPTSCVQPNSPGELSNTTLESFRANARSVGAAFRQALR